MTVLRASLKLIGFHWELNRGLNGYRPGLFINGLMCIDVALLLNSSSELIGVTGESLPPLELTSPRHDDRSPWPPFIGQAGDWAWR